MQVELNADLPPELAVNTSPLCLLVSLLPRCTAHGRREGNMEPD